MAETLYLIDGSSLLFRSFYAIRGLSTRDGRPTNAIFGTYRMVEKLLDRYGMERVAAVFDPPGPTFRHEAFEAYKANRPQTPPDLVSQIGPAKELLSAAGIPVLEEPGFEADDVIGTLAERAREAGMEVVVVTADKDLYQLVRDGVRILHTKHDERLLDAEGVEEVFGVRPDQVVDVLALWGDPTDNIPGVPGIGEKGAKELIRTYGTLERVIENAPELPRKAYREGLTEHADKAEQSRGLATVRRDVPMEVEIPGLRRGGPDAKRFEELCARFELQSLSPSGSEPRTELLRTECAPWPDEAWERLSAAPHAGIFLGDERLFLSDGERSWEAPPEVLTPDRTRSLNFCVYGLKPLLRRLGSAEHRPRGQVLDAALAGYLLNPSGATPTLSDLASETLGLSVSKDDFPGCAVLSARLHRPLFDRIDGSGIGPLYREVELPLVPILARMEDAGIAVETSHFNTLADEMSRSLEALEKEIRAEAGVGFNPASPKQVGRILFEHLKLPAAKKTSKTRSYSTDNEVLEGLRSAHPVVPLILEHRMLAKLKGTYVDPLPQWVHPGTGRIHAEFNQTVAATGRLSSSNPNLQNIPVRGEWGARIRAGFVAAEGCLFAGADYSQIELRILAHLSGDPGLLDAFARGEDIHTRTAAEVFGADPGAVTPDMRRQAKAVNFGILYGMGAFGLSRELGVGRKEAREFIDRYFSRFPSVRTFLDGIEARALEEEVVTTLLGRRRLFRGLAKAPNPLRSALLRQAVNTAVQGSAADLIKKAMVDAEPGLPPETRLVLQVHDELIAECPEGKAGEAGEALRGAMTGALSLSIPLRVSLSTGKRWSDLK